MDECQIFGVHVIDIWQHFSDVVSIWERFLPVPLKLLLLSGCVFLPWLYELECLRELLIFRKEKFLYFLQIFFDDFRFACEDFQYFNAFVFLMFPRKKGLRAKNTAFFTVKFKHFIGMLWKFSCRPPLFKWHHFMLLGLLWEMYPYTGYA